MCLLTPLPLTSQRHMLRVGGCPVLLRQPWQDLQDSREAGMPPRLRCDPKGQPHTGQPATAKSVGPKSGQAGQRSLHKGGYAAQLPGTAADTLLLLPAAHYVGPTLIRKRRQRQWRRRRQQQQQAYQQRQRQPHPPLQIHGPCRRPPRRPATWRHRNGSHLHSRDAGTAATMQFKARQDQWR